MRTDELNKQNCNNLLFMLKQLYERVNTENQSLLLNVSKNEYDKMKNGDAFDLSSPELTLCKKQISETEKKLSEVLGMSFEEIHKASFRDLETQCKQRGGQERITL